VCCSCSNRVSLQHSIVYTIRTMHKEILLLCYLEQCYNDRLMHTHHTHTKLMTYVTDANRKPSSTTDLPNKQTSVAAACATTANHQPEPTVRDVFTDAYDLRAAGSYNTIPIPPIKIKVCRREYIITTINLLILKLLLFLFWQLIMY